MTKNVYVVTLLDYDNNVKGQMVAPSLKSATNIVRKTLYKQATKCLDYSGVSEDYKEDVRVKAHAKYDNINVKLDYDEWNYWIGGSWSNKMNVRKVQMAKEV